MKSGVTILGTNEMLSGQALTQLPCPARASAFGRMWKAIAMIKSMENQISAER